jgi:hypothetical protein
VLGTLCFTACRLDEAPDRWHAALDCRVPWNAREDARIYALIAAISCFLPTMFMMRVRL